MSQTMSAKEYLSLPTRVKATRRKPVQRESQLQQAAVRWFRLQYPQYRRLLICIPNGGQRDKIAGARLKREGVNPGTPDFFLAIPRHDCHGVFIEMKYGRGKLSAVQCEVIHDLFRQRYRIEVPYSLEDFQNIINAYLK